MEWNEVLRVGRLILETSRGSAGLVVVVLIFLYQGISGSGFCVPNH